MVSYKISIIKLNPSALDLPNHSIVFSSWVKMLHLVGLALKDADINVIQYDGTLSLNEKQKVLNNFQTNPRIIVLLMSIGSGGVG